MRNGSPGHLLRWMKLNAAGYWMLDVQSCVVGGRMLHACNDVAARMQRCIGMYATGQRCNRSGSPRGCHTSDKSRYTRSIDKARLKKSKSIRKRGSNV